MSSYAFRLTGGRYLGWLLVIGITAVMVVSILYTSPVYRAVGATSVAWVYDLSIISFALLDTVLAFLLWRSSEKGEKLRMIWANLTLGLFLWAVGEMLWAVYELILREEAPYPSVADVVWICGFIPFFIAFYARYRSLGVTPTRRQALIGIGLAALLAILVAILVIRPILTSGEDASLAEQMLNIAYPLGDLLTALIVLLCMFALAGGALSRPWLILAAGFFVVSVADLLFSYATWNDLYRVGSSSGTNLLTFVTDILYYSSYVLIAFGLMLMVRLQRVI
jgi:hypothetical protein